MKTYKKRLIAVLLAVLVMTCSVVPAFAAQNKSVKGRKVVSEIVRKSLDYSSWEQGQDNNMETFKIDYSWDLPHQNVNIEKARFTDPLDYIGLVDQKIFKSNEVFIARLAATDVLGVGDMFNKNLDLIFCFSDMIRNGEIKHINKNEFNFYSQNGKLMRYTRKDDDSGKYITTSFKYDKRGNLISIREPEGTDTFTYDSKGKLVSFSYLDVEDNVCKITRDKNGQITKVNGCPYLFYDNGYFREVTTYDGEMRNGIGMANGEITTFYCFNQNSVNTAILHYTTI